MSVGERAVQTGKNLVAVAQPLVWLFKGKPVTCFASLSFSYSLSPSIYLSICHSGLSFCLPLSPSLSPSLSLPYTVATHALTHSLSPSLFHIHTHTHILSLSLSSIYTRAHTHSLSSFSLSLSPLSRPSVLRLGSWLFGSAG